MIELNDFYNDGFGWVCRHCERDHVHTDRVACDGHSRFMTEGEAEGKAPELSHKALARWADAAQTTLVCPKCGITELADIA